MGKVTIMTNYTITAFAPVNNDELREVVKRGRKAIFAETLDKTLACTYKVYGDNYVHVEFADNVISYVYDQYDGWSVRGISREDSVSALRALYVKLGGDYANVAGCVTDLEVLNKISVLYNGEDGARSYTEVIKNIADVIEPIREKWDGSATGLSEGSGDVNVSYKGSLIGSLSDTGSAVLKTENTVVKHDIDVEYTKPSTPISMPVYRKLDTEIAPTLITTYNGNGNTLIEVDLPNTLIYENVLVVVDDINNLGKYNKNLPFLFDDDHTVTIPTVNPSSIEPTANIVLIHYQSER